ncbi:MAG: MFS transporter [Pseudonocardia sp.]
MPGEMTERAGLGQVFRLPEFRALWVAELLSVAGDQLARVALAVLVFGRTGSAAWAAGVYALTFLPAILGGVLLTWVADRYRRREVMIAADVLRAVLVMAMAVPGLPLWALSGLLVAVVLLGSPHLAAQGALLPEVLPGQLYERGLAIRQITNQTAQVVGFATGGLLVAALSPSTALVIDAATFVLSAIVLRLGVVARPRPGTADDDAESGGSEQGLGGVLTGISVIFTDPRRRALVVLAWLIGFYIVPEALAAPYTAEIGAGPAAVGLLMAAHPLGSVIGVWLFVRFVPADVRSRLIGVLAVGAGVPLLVCQLRPGVTVAFVLWGLSGVLSTTYLMQAQACFVRATPDAVRGRAIGVAASGIIAAQGVAVLAGGLLADVTRPSTAIAVSGAAGSVLAIGGAVAWRLARSDGEHVSESRANSGSVSRTDG